MKIIDLQKEVTNILEQHDAPQRLIRHLTIVHVTAFYLVANFKNTWQHLTLNKEEITKRISAMTNGDFWEIFMELEAILEKIIIGADDRIAWQGI